ncbi:transketolase [bacterium]|nr:transketolase [bacterium]
MDKTELENLNKTCKKIRREVIEMIYNAKSGHPGGSLSAVEILTTLFKKCMNIYPDWDKNPNFKNRDRFILSKGHASATLYAVMAEYGYFSESELNTFRHFGTKLQGHPSCKMLNGIEVSTGSLGQGLSMANGIALAMKLDKNPANVFVYLGDGELQEGNIWEAAMAAAHYKSDNLIAFVDYNGLQIDGKICDIMNLGDISKKFEAFGWDTISIDGHNIEQIENAANLAKKNQKPTVIIAKTIKGKGVSFMENQTSWHGKAPNKDEYELAMKELED